MSHNIVRPCRHYRYFDRGPATNGAGIKTINYNEWTYIKGIPCNDIKIFFHLSKRIYT